MFVLNLMIVELDIKNGRHPVIENKCLVGTPYIANDVFWIERHNS
jgi:DNA mismatch repair ATPase MutS